VTPDLEVGNEFGLRAAGTTAESAEDAKTDAMEGSIGRLVRVRRRTDRRISERSREQSWLPAFLGVCLGVCGGLGAGSPAAGNVANPAPQASRYAAI
jgi:hypothetical protein